MELITDVRSGHSHLLKSNQLDNLSSRNTILQPPNYSAQTYFLMLVGYHLIKVFIKNFLWFRVAPVTRLKVCLLTWWDIFSLSLSLSSCQTPHRLRAPTWTLPATWGRAACVPYVETEPLANTTGRPAAMAARASSDAASAKTTCTRAGEDRTRTGSLNFLLLLMCHWSKALPVELVPNDTLMFVCLCEWNMNLYCLLSKLAMNTAKKEPNCFQGCN